jgi:hypothetical protein
MQKYLHQVFIQYNRSGQQSGDMGEWCSTARQQRWVRAASWKGGSANTIVHFPTVMIYSIALLEQTDFESIGRAMSSGTGAHNSVAMAEMDGPSKKKRKPRGSCKKRKDNKSSPNNDAMLKALHQGVKTEAQMSALRLILEYGSSVQKKKAMKEISSVAYGKKGDTHSESEAESVEGSNEEKQDESSNEDSSTSSND